MPEHPQRWARDAAQLYLAGTPLSGIATTLWIDQPAAAQLIRTGLEALAEEKLCRLMDPDAAQPVDLSRLAMYRLSAWSQKGASPHAGC